MPQSDFTFGEALDGAKGCAGTEWTHRDDANGRPVVEYICTAKLSSNLVEAVRKENADKLKTLTGRLDERWQSVLEAIKQHQSTLVQAQADARARNGGQLQELDAQLQAAQGRLNQALARTSEEYIGPVRNGYTPTLLAEGERRKQVFVIQVQQQIEGIQRQREAIEKELNDPAEAGRQFALGQYRSTAEYQRTLDGMLAWKDRYYAAMSDAEVRELKKAEEFLSGAKERKLQMKVTFLVRKKSPVEVGAAQWVYDGKDDGAVNTTYLAAVLLDPKRMQEVLESGWKSRLKSEINGFDYEQSFPIVCSEKLVDGCELRKPAS